MNDDVLQRNAAGELEIRMVASAGDTNTNKDDVYTRDNEGRLALRVSGGGGGGGASSAADLSVDPAGMTVIKSTNAQTAFEELDSAIVQNQNESSVLTTTVTLAQVVGQTTEILLDELTGVAGRPENKAIGATVYAPNGLIGIISETKDLSVIVSTVHVPGVVLELTTED